MDVAGARLASASRSAPRATLAVAGSLFVVAGVLMPFGEVVAVLGPSGRTSLPVWLVLLYPLGALVLIGGSIVLAVGTRGERGLVGRAFGSRAALVVSALSPLLLAGGYVSLLDAAFSPVTFSVFALLLLLCAAASVMVVVRVLQADDVPRPAQWGVFLFAGASLVTFVGGPLSAVAAPFVFAVLFVQPAVLVAAGVLLIVGRTRLEPADS